MGQRCACECAHKVVSCATQRFPISLLTPRTQTIRDSPCSVDGRGCRPARAQGAVPAAGCPPTVSTAPRHGYMHAAELLLLRATLTSFYCYINPLFFRWADGWRGFFSDLGLSLSFSMSRLDRSTGQVGVGWAGCKRDDRRGCGASRRRIRADTHAQRGLFLEGRRRKNAPESERDQRRTTAACRHVCMHGCLVACTDVGQRTTLWRFYEGGRRVVTCLPFTR